jgi:hypothetical protein
MKSIKSVLQNFKPTQDTYISREFQSFAMHLSEKLDDVKHKSLYMRLARDLPRPVLEKALRFVVDSNARNRAALFMWKLKDLNAFPEKAAKVTKKRQTD